MKKILFILLFVYLSMEGFSQDNHQYSFWGNFGGGLSLATRGTDGFSVNYGISSKYDFYMASIKRHNTTEFSLTSPQEKLNSTSLLIGLSNNLFERENQRGIFNINLLIGISYLEVYKRGNQISVGAFNDEYELNKVTTVGFPFELNAELRFTSYVGFSITVFSNLNKYDNLLGASVNLIFGYL